MSQPLAETRSLCKDFKISGENSLFAKTFPAVKDVSLSIYPGETFGIVGESGCGKSTVAKLMMCLEKPTSGEIWFRGQRVDSLPESKRLIARFTEYGLNMDSQEEKADDRFQGVTVVLDLR